MNKPLKTPPSAFPVRFGKDDVFAEAGMTLRDWFAGQALANPAICTGTTPEWQLAKWFGNRTGVHREEIVAKQARVFADAMLAERGQ